MDSHCVRKRYTRVILVINRVNAVKQVTGAVGRDLSGESYRKSSCARTAVRAALPEDKPDARNFSKPPADNPA